MTFSREEVEAEFLKYQHRTESFAGKADWTQWANDTFTEDAVYTDRGMGTYRGRTNIAEWFVSLAGSDQIDQDQLRAFYDKMDWYMVEGSRVVVYHRDGFADPRGRETFEINVVSILEYAGNGRWSYQEDVYNPKELELASAGYLAAKAELAEAQKR